jgi:hypothetical protein
MTDLGVTLPDTGGRVRLLLVEKSAEVAEYDATLAFPDGMVRGRMRVLSESGAVSAPPDGAPLWLGALATALLRAAHRRHAVEGWPRRITRWRAERVR